MGFTHRSNTMTKIHCMLLSATLVYIITAQSFATVVSPVINVATQSDSYYFSILLSADIWHDGTVSESYSNLDCGFWSSRERDILFDQFDPSLGFLQEVEFEWNLSGSIVYGITPHGPHFPPGEGTVYNGWATLGFSVGLPTSFPVSSSTSISGLTHTGSIAGPPGAGCSDTKNS